MASTTKDSLPETAAAAGSAAGAEIPVTVHASRYSSASKGAGKLPAVHEETRTVIILPQGAVVRLSAMVSAGELVVLTNNHTGADVICRVTNVKTQPGIQNYVHLEFTQRAPDFWEEGSAAGPAPSAEKPVAAAPRLAVPPPVPPMPALTRMPGSAVPAGLAGGKAPAPPVEVKSTPASKPEITPLAAEPALDTAEASAKPWPAPSRVSEISPAPPLSHKEPAELPRRSPRLQPFEASIPKRANASRSIVLFSIAAAVLLAIGAVGWTMLWRGDRGTAAALQVLYSPLTSNPAPLPAVSKSDAPIFTASVKANSPEPSAAVLPKNPAAETPVSEPAAIPPAVEPAKTEVQPPPPARTAINLGKISKPKLKKAAQLSSSEPPPVLPVENALPVVIGASVPNPAAQTNALFPVEPAAPAPVKGGQLQQPKLLSSVAAVYPSLARAQHVQGDVTIDALIDATGKVAATNVLTGNPLLQKAAIDSLRLWKYQPARLNGEPIPIHINVTVTFRLN